MQPSSAMSHGFTSAGSGATMGIQAPRRQRAYGLPGARLGHMFPADQPPPRVFYPRHGSAEQGDAPTPYSEGNVRAGPAGVQERTAWLEALNDINSRVHALERQQGSNANSIAKVKEVVTAHENKLDLIDKDLVAYKEYIEQHLHKSPASIAKSFEKLEERFNTHVMVTTELLTARTQAIDDQFLALGQKMQELKALVQSRLFSMDTGRTPTVPPDPLQSASQDHWARPNQDWQNASGFVPPASAPVPSNQNVRASHLHLAASGRGISFGFELSTDNRCRQKPT